MSNHGYITNSFGQLKSLIINNVIVSKNISITNLCKLLFK